MGLFQQLRKHLFYPLILRQAGDAGLLRWLRQFEQSQHFSSDQLHDLQQTRLRFQLAHAYQNCPGYRERFQSVGLTLSDLQNLSLDQITMLPQLSKADLQEQCHQFVAEDWPSTDLISNQTGGSTGTPVPFYLSHERRRSRVAATWRHNRWAGWDIGDRAAYLWGAPQDSPALTWRARLRRCLMGSSLWLCTEHVTEEKLLSFHQQLHQFRPRIIQAYARSLLLYAHYVEKAGLHPYSPNSVVISAEGLTSEERELVERVIGCPVYNRYGCREVSVIASECSAKLGLHVMAEGLYVEIVQGNQPAAPGQTGEILVTDLLNHAMPLIRYRIGDMGRWAEGPCTCGRALPRIKQIEGRVTDFLVGHDGRLVSGVFLATYVVAQRPSLGQVQIHQRKPGELCYRICPGRDFVQESDFMYLEQTSKQYLGETTVTRFELVPKLPREASGKFVFSRSTVTPELLRSPIDTVRSPD